MVNYKQRFFTHLNFNGFVMEFDVETMKLLKLDGTSLSTQNVSLHSFGNNYQVPTGKKFLIIYATNLNSMTTAGDKLFYADDADGNTNAVTITAYSDTYTAETFIYAYVPSEKYINCFDDLNSRTYDIVGVEMNN